MRVMHIITRMIVGGAQENTLYNCVDLSERHDDQVLLVTGPSLGAEGNLLQQSDQVSFEVETVDSLIRSINPLQDSKALSELKTIIRRWQPDVVHTHSAKAGLLGRAAGWSLRVPCVVFGVKDGPLNVVTT
jgi:hypothetical protein